MSSSSLSSQAPASTLSPCAQTCFDATLNIICLACNYCTDVNFLAKMFSCVQGECQAAELDQAHQDIEVFCSTGCLAGVQLFLIRPILVSATGKVTASTPFLPSNSNADRFIRTSVASSSVLTSSSSGGPSTVTSSPNAASIHSSSGGTSFPTSSHTPAQTSQTTIHRNSPRTAVIVASVVTSIVVLTLAILLVRMRRRRLHTREQRVPQQFLESGSREHIARRPSTRKVHAPAGADPVQANPVQEAVSDEAQLKHAAPISSGGNTDNEGLIDLAVDTVAPNGAERPTPLNDPQEPALNEETVTLRLRRVEAQLEGIRRLEARFDALLAVGQESSPPSYSG
ncbi:hypothetical protein MSAN_01544000 [Mycena sanguinolenta]|uniref:Uncharacterized protein n=1 Tax=Mycena sanguinolenta TaxID=230812 RepID=A0A8H6Y801_9AGAR|nr:hypothetical protein MSAN_01544000 [Mycena sanguinolenta]